MDILQGFTPEQIQLVQLAMQEAVETKVAEEVRSATEKIQGEIAEIKSQYDVEIQRLKLANRELETVGADASSQLEAENRKLADEIRKQKKDKMSQETAFTSQVELFKESEAKCSNLGRLNDLLKARNSSLQQEVNELKQAQKTEATSGATHGATHGATPGESTAEMLAQCEERFRTELARVTNELEETQRRNSSLRIDCHEVKSLRAENVQLEELNASIQAEKERLQKDLKQLTERKEHWKEQYRISQKALHEHIQQVETQRLEIAKLNSKYEELLEESFVTVGETDTEASTGSQSWGDYFTSAAGSVSTQARNQGALAVARLARSLSKNK